MYNDIEEYYMLNDFDGIDLGYLKLFSLLYADDILIMSETEEGLYKGLLLLEEYCDRLKLTVNCTKTKVMIFRQWGRIRQTIRFLSKALEIVTKFTFLGIVFTVGGYVNVTFEKLSGQALKDIFKLQRELIKCPCITVKHKLDLFDKLVLPFLNYGSKVWGLNDSSQIEKIHLQFCK